MTVGALGLFAKLKRQRSSSVSVSVSGSVSVSLPSTEEDEEDDEWSSEVRSIRRVKSGSSWFFFLALALPRLSTIRSALALETDSLRFFLLVVEPLAPSFARPQG